MGRHPKEEGAVTEASKNYFSQTEEDAVVEYLKCEDENERNKIFEEKLRYPFKKMIESIIRKYKLFIPDEDYKTTFDDTMSFLITKMDKFEPYKFKAYSYYGTICKNYLIGRIQGYSKTQERNPLLKTICGTEINSLKHSTEIMLDRGIAGETIDALVSRIKQMIEKTDEYALKETEVKLGNALVNLFENWDYVLTTDGSRKLNKSAILFYLKESTNMDAKGIRDNMKKFKKEFLIVKNFLLD